MKTKATIQKWGNSLALRLSGPMKAIPKFKADMIVDVNIEETGISIYPAKNQKKVLLFNEAELLKGLNKKSAHADLLVTLGAKEIGE